MRDAEIGRRAAKRARGERNEPGKPWQAGKESLIVLVHIVASDMASRSSVQTCQARIAQIQRQLQALPHASGELFMALGSAGRSSAKRYAALLRTAGVEFDRTPGRKKNCSQIRALIQRTHGGRPLCRQEGKRRHRSSAG